jgi:hypothetical protein
VIGPSGNVRVLVATKPVDFRKGAEGLAALVRETMRTDPVIPPTENHLKEEGAARQAD